MERPRCGKFPRPTWPEIRRNDNEKNQQRAFGKRVNPRNVAKWQRYFDGQGWLDTDESVTEQGNVGPLMPH